MPDLALYRDVIAEVRTGRSYYAVARETIPQYGFPIASPLNWRLPTYAWLLSKLPIMWIQAVLLLLAITGMWLSFVAVSRRWGVPRAGRRPFAVWRRSLDIRWSRLFGAGSVGGHVARHFDSLAGDRRGNGATKRENKQMAAAYRCLAIAAGILALLFRELALLYSRGGLRRAAYQRRWREAASWAVGIMLFFTFFAWHVGQVKAQLAEMEVIAAAGWALASGCGLAGWISCF